MRSVTRQYLVAFTAVLLGCTAVASWAQDQPSPFERFENRVPGRLPSEHVPEGDMLERDQNLEFGTDSPEEAQQRCNEYAREANLRACTARKTTYRTMEEGQKTNWYCVCR